jgi:small redox-active disulfide protein 2
MKIEILGPGCAKCQTLAKNTRTVVDQLGIDCEIEKITEIDDIVQRGVMMTPALVIDGVVKTVGRLASEEEIKNLLEGRQ